MNIPYRAIINTRGTLTAWAKTELNKARGLSKRYWRYLNACIHAERANRKPKRMSSSTRSRRNDSEGCIQRTPANVPGRARISKVIRKSGLESSVSFPWFVSRSPSDSATILVRRSCKSNWQGNDNEFSPSMRPNCIAERSGSAIARSTAGCNRVVRQVSLRASPGLSQACGSTFRNQCRPSRPPE